MKKLLAILLFAFALGGYALAEKPDYVIDEVATAAAPWKVGEVVIEESKNSAIPGYRLFLGVTTQGHYVVQEFYQVGDIKGTDPYRLLDQKDVIVPWSEKLLIDGPLVVWNITGEKNGEVMYENGFMQGPTRNWLPNGQIIFETSYQDGTVHGKTILWHENGQKAIEGTYYMGEQVGVWREWDKQGNLISEKDYALPSKLC